MSETREYFLSFLVLVVVGTGLWTAFSLTQERQEIRKEAAVSGGPGKISLSPRVDTKQLGEIFPVTINFQTGVTGGDSRTISSISLRITYPYSGVVPELDVVDSTGGPTNQIYPDSDLLSSGDWLFPIKSVSRSNGKVTIDLAAINTNISGCHSSEETPLATIYFKANQITDNPIILSFDPVYSKMMTKADPPEDILDIPPNGEYTVSESKGNLDFKIRFQGINSDQPATMVVRGFLKQNDESVYSYDHMELVNNGAGVFSKTYENLTAGIYTAFIKGPAHLQKNLDEVMIVTGQMVEVDGTAEPLKVGDFNDDNVLNLVDIGEVLSVYTALSVPVTSNNQIYDVDADNIINISDIALVLSNYTALEVRGD
jgi:hypothetical protein